MGIAAVFLLAAGCFIGYKTAYDSVEIWERRRRLISKPFTRRFVKGKPAVFW